MPDSLLLDRDNPCASEPCRNGATCVVDVVANCGVREYLKFSELDDDNRIFPTVDLPLSFVCLCQRGYLGKLCTDGKMYS